MALVTSVYKGSYPLIAYQQDADGMPILHSIMMIGIANTNETEKARIACDGDYIFLRTELLAKNKFDPKKSNLSVSQVNRLRRHLRDRFKIKGLEGEL